MTDEIIHVGAARDGSIVMFPFSDKYWLKVCNPKSGVGGIVDITNGAYYPVSEIESLGKGNYCKCVYDDLEDFFCTMSEED